MSLERPNFPSQEPSAEEVVFEEALERAKTIDDVVEAMKAGAEEGRFKLNQGMRLPVDIVEQMIRGEGGYDQRMINDFRLQAAVNRVLEAGTGDSQQVTSESHEQITFEEALERAKTIDDVVEAMKAGAEEGRFKLNQGMELSIDIVEQMIRGEDGYDQRMINDSRLRTAVSRVLQG